MQEKIIPQDITAEQSVLGAMLIDAGAVEKMAETLRKKIFTAPPTGSSTGPCCRCSPGTNR